MEELFEDLSKKLYDAIFHRYFEEKDWKTGYVLKKMDGETQEAFYIGARFDELYWQTKDKIRKNHFYVQILRNKTDEGVRYDISFHSRNVSPNEALVIDEIIKHVKEKEVDTLLYVSGYGSKMKKYPTGEKSEKVLKVMDVIRYASGISDYDEWTDEFNYPLTTTTLRVVANVEKETAKIYALNSEIANFNTIEEVKEWCRSQTNEDYEMRKVWDVFIATIKEKTKVQDVQNHYNKYIVIDRKTYVDVVIRKQYYSGKPKYHIALDKTKASVPTIEKAKEKAIEVATKFSNNYRLRKVTGQK